MAKAQYDEWLKPDKLILLQGWARDGLSKEQIAGNMGIHVGTLIRWEKEYDEIGKAIKKGREVCIYEVENATFKAAIGYDVTETEQIETTAPDGSVTVQKRARKRHVPPNATLAIFLLKNWKPNTWRDKPEPDFKEDTVNDGFLEALKGTASEDWKEEDDEE